MSNNVQIKEPFTQQTTRLVKINYPAANNVSTNRLDTKSDVEEISPANGYILVYRSTDDKYVVQQLSLDYLSGTLDGGSF
jgi:hypothetical protein